MSHCFWYPSILWRKDEAASGARGLVVRERALADGCAAREAVCRCVADFVKSVDAGKDRPQGSRSG